MMIKKRFNIVSSEIVEGGKFIQDNNKKYSFPTTIYPSSLVMYEKALNKLSDENEQLKQSLENKMNSDNFWEQKATEKIKELEDENERLRELLNIGNTNVKDLVVVLNTQEEKIETYRQENEQLKKELKELNKKYIAFSEATDKRLKELFGGVE